MDFMAPPMVDDVSEMQMPEGGEFVEVPSNVAPDPATDPMSYNLDISEFEVPAAPSLTQASPLDDSIPNVSVEELAVIAPPELDANSSQDINNLPDFSEIAIEAPTFEEPAIELAPEPVLNVGNIEDPMVVTTPDVPDVSVTKSIPVPVKPLSGESTGGVEAGSDYDVADKYYSSDRGVTTSDLNAPIKADPSKDPAQRIIIIDHISKAGDVDSRFVAAQRALDLRRYESALHMFESLYKGNKRDQRILMGRAVALQMTGQEEKAVQAYEELLDLSPKNPKVLVNLLGLISQQYPTVALERLGALYEKFPGNAAIAAQMGLAEAGLNNYESALKYIGIATSLEPGNAQHYFNLAVVYDHNREYKKAIAQYERSLEVDSLSRQGTIKRDVIYDRLSRLRQM